jgi:hypothetical protein
VRISHPPHSTSLIAHTPTDTFFFVVSVTAATGVGSAMEKYADAMSDDFAEQLKSVRSSVLRAVLLDDTLRLTNGVELFTTYVLGDGGSGVRRAYKVRISLSPNPGTLFGTITGDCLLIHITKD